MTTSLHSLASLQSCTTPTATVTPFTSSDSSAASVVARSRHAPSRSLSFINSRKNKFSSLVRSRSVRASSEQQETVVLADYESQLPSNSTTTMNSREHEGLSRKSENKLYKFFTSRSRSRSKARSQSADVLAAPSIPPLPVVGPSSHARHTSLDDTETRYPPFVSTSPITYANFNAGASGSKPMTRSQSRPLSTTTTATHSTITSLVAPTQRRLKPNKFGSGGRSVGRPASATSSIEVTLDTQRSDGTSPYASQPPSSRYHSPPLSPPPEVTPQGSFSSSGSKQPTSTRLRLHNLFGIPLTNSRRSSFGSRATTPNSNASGPSSTPPPVPPKSRYADLKSLPLNRPSLPSDHRRTTSPSPLNHAQARAQDKENKEKEKRRSATTPASWLAPRFFSGSGSTVDRSRGSDSGSISRSGSPPPPLPCTILTAVNPDSTSTLHTQTTHTHASSGDRDRGIGSSIHAPHATEDVPPVPKIMHTPPTPQKGNDSENGSATGSLYKRRSLASPRASVNTGHARNRSLVVVGESSLDGLMAGMGSTSGLGSMSEIISEERSEERESVDIQQEKDIRRGRWSPRFFGGDSSRDKGKQKERERDVEREREKARAKLVLTSSRVGSPMDGRFSPSIASAPRSARSKHGSFDFESSRPKSGGSSSHTLGIHGGRIVGITTPSMAKPKSRSRDGHNPPDGNGSAVGNGAVKLERSVSFSDRQMKSKRNTERDAPPPSTSPRMHLHGLTEAEPVPTLPTQPGSLAHPAKKTPTPTGVTFASSWGRTTTPTTPTIGGSIKRRVTGLTHGSFAFEPAVPPSTSPSTSEFGVIRSGDSGYGEGSNTATTASTTNGINQRRGKGRSLDLNIGLSWAPTKVKPEAIMSAFGSKGKERREKEREEDKRKFEDGVHEAFRDVLGETGYANFRKYIRRFDTQVIPFDGPGGLVTRVEKLLDTAPPPRLQEREKYELLDRFIKVVLHNT